MTGIDPRALRSAFGSFMTGVTVVTAMDADAAPLGFTANSFTSVSLDPPLLLVCLAKSSSNYAALTQAAGFAVNILSDGQSDISNTFARPSDDRFAGLSWQTGPHGSPILGGVSAWFDCARHDVVDAGDHTILIGEVKAFDSTPAPGLGYVRGAYVSASTTAEALAQASRLVVSALIERDGALLMVGCDDGGMLLPETAVGPGESVSGALKRLVASTGLSAEPGFIYSVFEDVRRQRQHISFLCQAATGAPDIGTFVPMVPHAFETISDPAILTMVERFAAESAIGAFGIYYGDQNTGEVRHINTGRS